MASMPHEEPGAGARVLFLVGVPRSGTTATAKLLNRHSAACVGIERYKYRFLRGRQVVGDEFFKDRFFDFRQGDTNILPTSGNLWRDIYDKMSQKWDSAAIVGDKIPHLYKKYKYINDKFPNALWIYILRSVHDVASSWNVRARKMNDSWPIENDYREAVDSWNEANCIVDELQKNGAKIGIISYETLFSGSREYLHRFMNYVGLGLDDEFTRACRHLSQARAQAR